MFRISLGFFLRFSLIIFSNVFQKLGGVMAKITVATSSCLFSQRCFTPGGILPQSTSEREKLFSSRRMVAFPLTT